MRLLSRAAALLTEQRPLGLELDPATAVKFSGDVLRAEELLNVVDRARAQRERHVALRAELELFWPRWTAGKLTNEQALTVVADATSLFEASGDDHALGRASHLEALIRRGIRGSARGGRSLSVRALTYGYRRVRRGSGDRQLDVGSVAARGPTPCRRGDRTCHEVLREVVTPGWRSFVLPPLAIWRRCKAVRRRT